MSIMVSAQFLSCASANMPLIQTQNCPKLQQALARKRKSYMSALMNESSIHEVVPKRPPLAVVKPPIPQATKTPPVTRSPDSLDMSLRSLIESLESRIQTLESRPIPSVEELATGITKMVQEQLSTIVQRMVAITISEHFKAH